MKNNQIQDERIIAERQKIQSTGYSLVVIALIVSLVVQKFFMNAPLAQMAAEIFILIGCGIYYIIANYTKGIDIFNPKGDSNKKIFLKIFFSGFLSALLLAFLSGNHKVDDLILYFVTYVTVIFVFRLVMIGINKKKREAIDKELIDDDVIE